MFEQITANWTIVDWLFIGWMVFSIILGTLRGFIAEMLSLIGWVIAFAVAFQYGEEIGKMVPLPSKEPTVVFVVGFIVSFIGTLITWAIAKTLLRFAVGHGWIDHVLGLAFGVLRGILVAAISVGLVSIIFPLAEQEWWKKSQSHGFLEKSALEVKALLPADWGNRMQLDIDNIKKKIPASIPAIANSLPSSVKDEIANTVKEEAIKSITRNTENKNADKAINTFTGDNENKEENINSNINVYTIPSKYSNDRNPTLPNLPQ